jgi:hypothetical protein
MNLASSHKPERQPDNVTVAHAQLTCISEEVMSLSDQLRTSLPDTYGYFRRTGLSQLGWEKMHLAPVDGKLLRIGTEITLFEAGMAITLNYRSDPSQDTSEITVTKNGQISYWVLRRGATLHNRTFDINGVVREPNLVDSLTLASEVLHAARRCKEFYCDHPMWKHHAEPNT